MVPGADEVIDNGDGTWSTSRVSTTDEYVDGAFTWAYVGQAVYPWHLTCATEKTFVHRDEPPLRLVDRSLRWRRTGADGEVWAVVAVDERLLDAELVAAADEQVADWAPGDPDWDGRVETWIPTGWTTPTCSGTGNPHLSLFDGESRVAKPGPTFSDRQQAAVKIKENVGGTFPIICSGVLLTDTFVLTAHHCVEGDDDVVTPASDLRVQNVLNESVHVANVHETDFNSSPGNSDYDRDWVLLELDEPFPTHMLDMDLWDGEDSVYASIGANVSMLGYPSVIGSAGGSCVSAGDTLFLSTDNDVTSTAYQRIKLKADGSSRQSGAPYFFCPAGNAAFCAEGELGQVVGLQSGYNPVEQRQIGPKANSFRPEALSIINN